MKVLKRKFLKRIRTYMSDTGLVEKALEFGKSAHKAQKRKDGTPFFKHPMEVAFLLAGVSADEATIISALLHDTVEDTDVALSDLEDLFGKEIATLVDGVTKFSKHSFSKAETLDVKLESLRKWFDVMRHDVRVAVIKLADRIHNMRTLAGHNNAKKQQGIAKETVDLYVKIAGKLGILVWKRELMDLAMPYLDGDSHKVLVKIKAEHEKVADSLLVSLKETLFQLKDKKVNDIIYDSYSFYGLYLSEVHLSENPHEIMVYRFFIVVSNVQDCYDLIYFLHQFWRRERGSFQDFINTPSVNGYQALHTTVILEDGSHVCFKIQTHDMHLDSQYGVLRYCFSAEFNDSHVSWLRNLEHITEEDKERSQFFWEALQHDILDDSIVVHGPNDKVILLPHTSTVLDAVFFLYGEKGCSLTKTIVNGKEVSFYHGLADSDQVNFDFGNYSMVSYEWLDFVDTKVAASHIKHGLCLLDKGRKIVTGRNLLQNQMFRNGNGLIEEIDDLVVKRVLKEYRFDKMDGLYQKIAEGFVSPVDVCEKLFIGKLKNNHFVKKKFFNVYGSLEDITHFLSELPQPIKSSLKCYLRPIKGEMALFGIISSVSVREWDRFLIVLKRRSYIKCGEIGDYRDIKRRILIFSLLILFWGIDPVFAHYLLNTSITPFALTVLRFWSVSIFLGGLIVLNVLLKRDSRQSSLAFFQKDAFLLSIFLLFVAFFTYIGLQDAFASDYLLILRLNAGFFLALSTYRLSRKFSLKVWASYSLVLLGCALLFIVTPGWDMKSKIWISGGVLAFACYSFYGSIVKKKLKIYIRYYRLQLLVNFYAAILASLLLMFFGWPNLSVNEYLMAVFFGIVFTGIPHLLFFYLVRKESDVSLISYRLSFVYVVALIAEMLLYNVYPSAYKLISVGFVFLGLFFVSYFYRRLKKGDYKDVTFWDLYP